MIRTQNYAVITADLIKSRFLSDKQRKLFISYIEDFLKSTKKDFNLNYQIIRGDSFQCITSNISDSFKLLLCLKYLVKAGKIFLNNNTDKKYIVNLNHTDIRLSLAIDRVSILEKDLSKSDGKAFQKSGWGLDEISKDKYFTMIFSSSNSKNDIDFNIILNLTDEILKKTTAAQCEVILYKLRGLSEAEISKILGINISAVNQRSKAGGWNSIKQSLLYLQTKLSKYQ